MTTTETTVVAIGPATANDLPALLALLTRAGLPTDGLAEHVGAALVARDGDRVVGSAALELYGQAALLRSVAVDADQRGQGLGVRLTEAALDLARRRGVRRVYLLTETAERFFPRFGFRPIERGEVDPAVGESVEFASACPASARAMVAEMEERSVANTGKADTAGPTSGAADGKSAIHEAVRARYAASARRVLEPLRMNDAGGGCCAPTCCTPSGESCKSVVTRDLYSVEEASALPGAAVEASLGCGNPTALIDLRPGEVVLDLGSGGGVDVLLSARRVGPTGKAYGVDMTDEMLELARRNAAEAGATNVEFLKGRIERVPLPDAHVDVVISNCVINLAPDKREVLREAFRVLKPGGRFAVSDVVVEGPVPDDLRRQVELWVGCLAGALERREYEAALRDAGFETIEIVPTRYYRADEMDDPKLAAWLAGQPETERERLSRAFMSAFVRATKPA